MAYSILVVDDEESIRELYREEFEDDGYYVFDASDGLTAMEILENELVHVVVLDIKLKGESGLQVLQNITRKNEDMPPVILSTAYGSYRNDFSSWLADAYVVKSFNLTELKQQITRLLSRCYGLGPVN